MTTSVIDYLKANAALHPDKLALFDEHSRLTYKEALEATSLLAQGILSVEETITHNQPVAVLIGRNVSSVLAFWAVAYCGGFYVPIDPSMPVERVSTILASLAPALIISSCEDSLSPEMQSCLSAKSKLYTAEELIGLGRTSGLQNTLEDHYLATIDTDPLYAIYTSGSTGQPKGVVISHRSVVDLTDSFAEAFAFTDDCVFGNQAPFDFDVSVKDIYNSLRSCASLCIIPKNKFSMPRLLLEYIKDQGINTLIWAVSALRIVADFKTFNEVELPELKYVMFSGEVMPIKALNYWRANVRARYVNLYGPTEITCNCTYYEVTGDFDEGSRLPIGRPFKNTRVFLMDQQGQIITAPGVEGEICVQGTCLSLGYWQDKAKNDSVFPLYPNDSGRAYIYKTGDLGYYNSCGDLEFAGRRDYQIKHMGHRIELGDIECALNAIAFIQAAVCCYDEADEKIICFYQADVEDRKGIVNALVKTLPKYMWPYKYIYYDRLPLNKNGKIDRKLLMNTYKQG